MRMRIRWWLLLAALFLAPASAFAQPDVPPVLFTGPLSHPRYDDGGVFGGIVFRYMKTNRPLWNQQIAIRGIFDFDGQISGTINQLVGSGEEAVNVSQLHGPGINQPGYDLFLGYRFHNGLAISLQWRHLVQGRYTYQAAILPPSFNQGALFENTFLSAKVSNFPTDWAGNATNVPVGTTATTFGIWNAASLMQIEFVQRYDIYGINVRVPMWETSEYRNYGIFGPRIVWIWDRFKWRTVDQDETGVATGDTIAIYSNTISNRMYGVHFGFGNDWFLGVTPVGAFAFNIDIEGGLYLDLVKARAAWDREDRAVGIHRSRRFNNLVPAVELKAGFFWYPWEAISMYVGYDFAAYFNTTASPHPVDFNMGTVDPEYRQWLYRHFHGLNFGINFVF